MYTCRSRPGLGIRSRRLRSLWIWRWD